jgi:hypothetical protein
MSTHTENDLDLILEIFAKLARELGTFDDPVYTEPGRRRNVFDFALPEHHGAHEIRADSGVASLEESELYATVSR